MTGSAMQRHFLELADYNRWANRRLYRDAAALPPEASVRDVGVYFASLFATLEHILKVDRAWLHLLDGGALADLPPMPDVGDLARLTVAREATDAALIVRVESVDEAWLESGFAFSSTLEPWRGLTYRGSRAAMLMHVFNHQTHHRGQAHSALSLLGAAPSALDILVKGMLGE
jgi:uncharacterized damage-inducible protein DinB